MSHDLLALEAWMQEFIARLDGPARKQLASTVGRELRKLQGKNIKAQRSAEGQAWERRKKTKAAAPPLRFVYRSKDGHVREVELSSWRNNGGSLTGHDKEAGGRRTLLKVGILRNLPARGSVSAAQQTRAQRMLQRMATARTLRMRTTNEGVELSFADFAERIAAVHHFGQRDHVRPGGPEVDYPARPLLGIGPKERQAVLQLVHQHLSA